MEKSESTPMASGASSISRLTAIPNASDSTTKLSQLIQETVVIPSPKEMFPVIYFIITGKIWSFWPFVVLFGLGATMSDLVLPYLLPSRPISMLRLVASLLLGLPTFAILGMVWFGSKSMVIHRLEAFKSAQNSLSHQISTGRAHRRKGYDLYLPPPSNEIGKDIGLILIPGALVDPRAYSVIASKLADQGIVVVVINTEPYRAPCEITGTSHPEVMKILYDVLSFDAGGGITVKEWAIGGHSMGGRSAYSLLHAMKPGVSKLLLWGMIRSKTAIAEPLKDDPKANVLVLVGSKDPFYIKEDWVKLRDQLPKRKTKFVEIPGGNHSGFGHYGPQVFPKKDGNRSITLDQQQDVIVKETIKFLSGGNISGEKKED